MSKTTPRIYQVGDHWLAKRPRSKFWHRCSFDTERRQTRYVSLKTEDIEEAKSALDKWFVGHLSEQSNYENPRLHWIMDAYYEEHAKNLSSASSIKLALRHWKDYFGDIEIADLREIRVQEGFHKWLQARGQVNNSVNRTLALGKAAINRAWKYRLIEHPPAIAMLKSNASPPKGRPMEISEIARLIDATDCEHLIDFIIWGLATGARPSAIRDLTWQQVDFNHARIDLNPKGREQNNKRRPVVRLPEVIAELYGMAHHTGLQGPVVSYKGDHVKSIRTAWRKAREKAGLDKDCQPYSLRHTVAKWLRVEGIPAWEVAAQLGHKDLKHAMTERYASFSPDYLEGSVEAIDKLLNELRYTCVTLAKPRIQLNRPKLSPTKGLGWCREGELNSRPHHYQ